MLPGGCILASVERRMRGLLRFGSKGRISEGRAQGLAIILDLVCSGVMRIGCVRGWSGVHS